MLAAARSRLGAPAPSPPPPAAEPTGPERGGSAEDAPMAPFPPSNAAPEPPALPMQPYVAAPLP
eukprot:9805923-Alexandrium_andersonii.AAC.1